MEQDEVLLQQIEIAFGAGETSLGILAITDIPQLEELRNKLLPMARQLALLPKRELDAVTDVASGYQVGWSHGREKLEGDRLDLAKGSFYANPLTDNFLESRPETDPTIAQENPAFFAPNVWPKSSLPDFEGNFKALGTLVCAVGRKLARLCDAYVKSKVREVDKDSNYLLRQKKA